MEYVDMTEGLLRLVGKTLVSATGKVGDRTMVFMVDDGSVFTFFHDQDCCESVTIEDISGDLSDLIGCPILLAQERISSENPDGIKVEFQDVSFTWTFYEFATIKGSVTIRWYGESNGYYSESVDLKVSEP